VKVILDARAEISFINYTKNNMKYVSSMHFNHNFKSGSNRQLPSSKKEFNLGLLQYSSSSSQQSSTIYHFSNDIGM